MDKSHKTTVFTFRELVERVDLDPKKLLVMRHTPKEPKFAKIFQWLPLTKPHVYNAYQSTHKPKEENQLRKAEYLASFIGNAPEEALFVGIYQVCGEERMTLVQLQESARFNEMAELGGYVFHADHSVFDLRITDILRNYAGRIRVRWSGGLSGGRTWSRWMDSKVSGGFPIISLQENSLLETTRPIPHWSKLVLDWSELASLPQHWKTTLGQWRGIYFIFDTSDGKGYVGSAYGTENIWGRWSVYAISGHGHNKLLKRRDPKNFRFSILQRVSPDLPVDDVVKIESDWKARLHTREFGLNDN